MSPNNLTIEAHGDEYALYEQRDQAHHGYRLCNIHDFDANKKRTLAILNASLEALHVISKMKLAEEFGELSPDLALAVRQMHEGVMKVYRQGLE